MPGKPRRNVVRSFDGGKTLTVYRVGSTHYLSPIDGCEQVEALLAREVKLGVSNHSGRPVFFRANGTFGVDLQTAIDAGWVRLLAPASGVEA